MSTSSVINGHTYWFFECELHRVDGPAVEYSNEDKAWYIHGKIHREDGPAFINHNGGKVWAIQGKRHREDGPAVEWGNGREEWYFQEKYHRLDGPAIKNFNGIDIWYITGQDYTKDIYQEAINKLGAIKDFLQFSKKFFTLSRRLQFVKYFYTSLVKET